MNNHLLLKIASLLSLLFTMVHLTQDVLLQAAGSITYPIPIVVFTVWLYGTLALSDRLAGYIIMFLGGLIAAAMIVVHSKGIVVSASGGLFFVWILFFLGTTGWITMVLAARGIWSKRRRVGVQ